MSDADANAPAPAADPEPTTTAAADEEKPDVDRNDAAPEDDKPAAAGDGDDDAAAADDDERAATPNEEAEAMPEPEPEPAAPETPRQTRDLREKLTKLKEQVATREAEVEEARKDLASRRAKDAIAADTKAAQKATDEAHAAKKDAEEREEKSRQVIAGARGVGARLERYEAFAVRVGKWVDTDVAAKIKADQDARAQQVSLDVLKRLRELKDTRDQELASLDAMVTERDNNRSVLSSARGSEPSSPARSSGRKSGGKPPLDSSAPPSARRGYLSSPTARTGTVEPLPRQPSQEELAAWDLGDYKKFNDEARREYETIRSLRKSYDGERHEAASKNIITSRKLEAAMKELAYQQRHLQQELLSKKQRVAELDSANASLATSLQYANHSFHVAWPSAREYLESRKCSPRRKLQRKSGTHDGEEDDDGRPAAAAAEERHVDPRAQPPQQEDIEKDDKPADDDAAAKAGDDDAAAAQEEEAKADGDAAPAADEAADPKPDGDGQEAVATTA